MRLACNAEMGVVLLRYFSYAEIVYSSVAVLPRRAEIVGLSSVSRELQQSDEKHETEERYHLSLIWFQNQVNVPLLSRGDYLLKSEVYQL